MTKRKTTAAFQVRQGDVLFIREDGIKGVAEIAPKGDRIVLAIGETSGHCHAIDSSKARFYRLAQDAERIELVVDRMLHVIERAVVHVESTHSRARQDERHIPVTLPPGNYRVRVMREYDPFMVRSTAD
jgi:hypothetical protein